MYFDAADVYNADAIIDDTYGDAGVTNIDILNNNDNRGESLPRTGGIESAIWSLMMGLITSLFATMAVIVVIRWRNKKEKKA